MRAVYTSTGWDEGGTGPAKQMTIGIDISQLAHAGTGVARYNQMLVNALCAYDKNNKYVFFFSSLRRKIPDAVKKNILDSGHRLVEKNIPPTLLEFLWNRLHVYPIDNFIDKVDVFISSDWTQPPSSAPKKITVIHDLVYLRFPETVHPSILTAQRRRMNWVKKEADLILADSESTKKDLIRLLGFDKNRIKVVYPAVEIQQSPFTSHFSPPTSNKYILSVGKLEPRKNIPRLVTAFQKANLKNIDLLIVGPYGWKAQASPGVAGGTPRGWRDQDNIKFLGYISDPELYSLYKNALFFIYPSLYEGFGYPVIEAMSLGCPVAASDSSSIKEIAEGSALLFNPESTTEIANAITKLSGDETLRKDLSAKGKKKAGDFTLKNFASSFLQSLGA